MQAKARRQKEYNFDKRVGTKVCMHRGVNPHRLKGRGKLQTFFAAIKGRGESLWRPDLAVKL